MESILAPRKSHLAKFLGFEKFSYGVFETTTRSSFVCFSYSGVAWATIPDFLAGQVEVITSWPGTGREEGKAPTELFYENDQFMWGYEVPFDCDPIRWVKLLLLEDDDLSDDLRSSEFFIRGRRLLRECGKTAVEVVADYLGALWEHTLSTIAKSRGELALDTLAFHVVITVPAIWKGYTRDYMQQAVVKAGILKARPAGETTLSFAPEPEAAALATLAEARRGVRGGDVYVVCDAGGGTVVGL